MDSAYIYSLGWTLIHSIWQLTALAVLFYFIMVSFRDRKPGSRYLISLLFMIMSVSVTCLTFILMYRQFSIVPTVIDTQTMAYFQMPMGPELIEDTGFWTNITWFLQSNITSMTYMYIIGVGLLMMRMGINFWSLNRLRNDSSFIDTKKFPYLENLRDTMDIRKDISFRSSLRVGMPMVIGALQPVVLIPAALLSNTSPHILKAVIAHELAHIERHDFLINIAQSVIETLFFYHPAVWYFSYIVRREREFCCDLRAVEAGCDREDLARALSEVGELHRNKSLSMAFGGQSNDLLNRVKYLLGMKPSFRYVPDHSVWYYGSLMGLFLLFSIGKSQFFQSNVPDSSTLEVTDTIPVIVNQNEKVVNLKVEERIDTIVRNHKIVNAPAEMDSVKVEIRLDTTIVVYDADSIPQHAKTVVVHADGKVKVIVNGDEVVVYDADEMEKLNGRLRKIHFDAQSLHPGIGDLDSMIAHLELSGDAQAKSLRFSQEWLDSLQHNLAGIQARGKTMRFSQEWLDSLQQNLSGIQSRVQSFQFNFPDSSHNFAFSTPDVEKFNLDSLFDRKVFDRDFHHQFFLDSAFLDNHRRATTFFRDSMFSFYNAPFVTGKQFDEIKAKSQELQELSREIQAKERELQKLRREQQKQYREELKKMREGN